MKKVFLLVTLFISILLIGCSKSPQMISDVEEFETLFTEAIKYDIRSDEECEAGHIKGFMCVGSKDKDTLIKNISIIAENKKTNIILIGKEDDCIYILEGLAKKGFKNLYYFENGYQGYVEKKGESFIPETGCGC